MTLLVVLILHGTSLAHWIRTNLLFPLSLTQRALLHELGLARRHIQATKRAEPACDGPGWRACEQPNAPSILENLV